MEGKYEARQPGSRQFQAPYNQNHDESRHTVQHDVSQVVGQYGIAPDDMLEPERAVQ
jgi:hypothetical protein